MLIMNHLFGLVFLVPNHVWVCLETPWSQGITLRLYYFVFHRACVISTCPFISMHMGVFISSTYWTNVLTCNSSSKFCKSPCKLHGKRLHALTHDFRCSEGHTNHLLNMFFFSICHYVGIGFEITFSICVYLYMLFRY